MGYQLVRSGKAATAKGVKDIFILFKGVNKFGRHSKNDHYLESSVLQHFISRWHAEIVYTPGKGRQSCLLKDKGSINGTYVNSTRVDKETYLHAGDTITFGHTNGKHIAPGQHSPQAESEFQFRLVEMPLSSDEDDSDSGSSSVSCAGGDDDDDDVMRSRGVGDFDDKSSASSHSSNSASSLPTSVTRPSLRPGAASSYLSTNTDNHYNKSANGSRIQDRHSSTPSSPGKKGRGRGRPRTKSTSPGSHNNTPTVPAKRGRKRQASTDASPRKSAASKDPTSTHNTKRKKATGSGTKAKKKVERAVVTPASSSSDEDQDEGAVDLDAAVNSTTAAWHYVSQACDAPECKHPTGKKVQWVQCDDCEGWFHVSCVGISFNSVKNSEAEFHCGYC